MSADNDLILVERYRAGDESAFGELYLKYIKLIKMLAGSYVFSGADEGELVQEGVTGLWNAVKRFDPEREGASSFGTFAYLCIQSQIKNALRTRSGETPTDFDGAAESETFSAEIEDEIIKREIFRERVIAVLEVLSSFEKDVFILYLRGYSYREIASILKKPAKSVDNALVRIKAKAKSVGS